MLLCDLHVNGSLSHTPRSMAVCVRKVGRIAYRPCLVLQQRLVEKYADRNQPKVLTVESVAMT